MFFFFFLGYKNRHHQFLAFSACQNENLEIKITSVKSTLHFLSNNFCKIWDKYENHMSMSSFWWYQILVLWIWESNIWIRIIEACFSFFRIWDLHIRDLRLVQPLFLWFVNKCEDVFESWYLTIANCFM